MSVQDPVNILLVDDQPAKLLSYEVILSDLGESLIKAASAREAFVHLLRTDIAVVLVDVCMPELDGFQLVRMLREHPRFEKTAVIFVSAIHHGELDLLRGYESGAVDYVPVPVVPEILRAKVRIFVDLYRKTRQLEQMNSELERRVAERTAALEESTARLKESEQRRSVALAAGRMGSWDWDVSSGAVAWDDGQHRIFGVEPGTIELTFDVVRSFIHPEDLQRVRELVDCEPGGSQTFQTEARIIRPDGEVRWCVCAGAVTRGADGSVMRASGVTIDITERKQAEDKQLLLMTELDHRVKNILANVIAMARLSGTQADSVQTFVGALEGRVQAMARAHALLRQNSWTEANLSDLVSVALMPFRSLAGDNIQIRGGPLPIRPGLAQTLALVVHELATNAVKHGALSTPGGLVAVEWQRLEHTDNHVLSWRESGGPLARKPESKGLGLSVIERAASEIGGSVELEFHPAGLRCAITGPLHARSNPARKPVRSVAARSRVTPEATPEGDGPFRVLIVEDEPLIAMQLQEELEENGYDVVGPAHNLDEGLHLVSTAGIDAALVDVSLGRDTSVGVAEELQARAIPFAFTTGYDDAVVVPEHLRTVPRLKKPYEAGTILAFLHDLVGQECSSRQP